MSRVSPTGRLDYLIVGFVGGLLFTFVFALGMALGMELGAISEDPINEDARIFGWSWRKFDEVAFMTCIVAGVFGQALQFVILNMILG